MTETSQSAEIAERNALIIAACKTGANLTHLAEKYELTTIDIAKIIYADPDRPRPAHRPPKYETPEEMQALIELFFDQCQNILIIKQVVQKGEIILVPTPTPPTMAGLAFALNISREKLNNYKGKPEFGHVIARARERIEHNNITMGLTGVYESRINNLNLVSNFGYTQRSEVDVNIKGGHKQLTDEERALLQAETLKEIGQAKRITEG